jgi:lipopolysaccharide/colanic/teichoic acid biosynthesis glycosyltransferase
VTATPADRHPGYCDSSEVNVTNGIHRSIEIVISSGGLLLAAPVIACAAVAIKLGSDGPVFFRQQRVGRHGQLFLMYKLRTMRTSERGPGFTARDDSRVTRVGKWLRKTKLDELPELWNVLKGEMSLVGPRPEVPAYVDSESPDWRAVLTARPGITDPMTLRLRNEESLLAAVDMGREEFYLQRLQPYKLKGYRAYLERRNWRSDTRILCQTLIAVIFPSKVPAPPAEELDRL